LAARLVKAQPHEIAFLRNTSEGLSVIANGFPWKPGDNLVTAAAEFPANLYPWQRIGREYHVDVRLYESDEPFIDIDQLLELVDENTRLLTISWVQFATGQRLDIRRIGQFCRERGIMFVVDAVQGLGVFQLDVVRDCVDAFAASAHKFLLGPKGIALLYVSEAFVEVIRPVTVGWTAVNNYRDYLPHDFDFRDGAVRFEGGTLNEVGICGLGQTLELLLDIGPEQTERHVLSLSSYLMSCLRERGYEVLNSPRPEEDSAIVVCRHHRYPPEQLSAELEARDIITSARLERLRIAPHLYNTLQEVDALIEALPA
jgi:selenocysteine lyase/cysteine desulfurase